MALRKESRTPRGKVRGEKEKKVEQREKTTVGASYDGTKRLYPE